MRKIILLTMLCLLALTATAQNVSNVRFEQAGKMVKIYYDLSEDADVVIYLSTDGGRSYGTQPIGHVSGAVGQQVSAGSGKCVVWDVLNDRDRLQGETICFKVKAARRNGNQTFTVGGVTFTMVYIKGGTFSMGAQKNSPSSNNYDPEAESDESPVHTVSVGDFYIGQFEVTQKLWKAVMGTNPSYLKGDDLPVENVSYEDIVNDFLPKLNRMTGCEFRLPTEAEWEYAARGGKNTSLYNGENIRINGKNNSPNLDRLAWYAGNCGQDYTSRAGCDVSKGYDISGWTEKQYNDRKGGTHPVGQKQPNAYGLYDMLGNVWEWCSDWYGSSYYGSGTRSNPGGASSGSYRVLRGGSWGSNAWVCRVSNRGDSSPSGRYSRGFRLVLSR